MSEEFSEESRAGDRPGGSQGAGGQPTGGSQGAGGQPTGGSQRAGGQPTGSPAPGDDFQTAFWAAKHALSMVTAAAFSRHGVHEGQQFILRCLWAQDGMTPGEIARRLGLATPTVTRAATRMEAAGLVRREPDPADRRLVRLRLTDRGRSLEEVIGAETDALTERALATFDPVEREAVIRALHAIRQNLTAG